MGDRRRKEHEIWSALALGLKPVLPPPELRARLMDSIKSVARFGPFAASFASVFDLDEASARDLLARAGSPEGWIPGVGSTLGYLDFEPGPRLAPAHCGLVRMRARAQVPTHRHEEREITFVLAGSLIDDTGCHHGPGRVLDMPVGSTHSLRVGETETLVAVLLGALALIEA